MLRKTVSQYFGSMQRFLFPEFRDELGPTTDKHLQVIVALDMIRIEEFLPYKSQFTVGRPTKDRDALARALIAKPILGITTTTGLIDRLKVDAALKRLCGFHGRLPSEATFSNAFAEFSACRLMEKAHAHLVKDAFQDKIVGHVSRDSTAIDCREKPLTKEKVVADSDPKNRPKRGRPKKDEIRSVKEPSRIERQLNMSVEAMLEELPTASDTGCKKDSKGNPNYWIGYKLHVDVDDNGIPLTAILTSASLHDSQVAIPLEAITSERVISLYSLMDAAYNSEHIVDYVTSRGKVSIIDPKKPRGGEKIPLDPAKKERFKIRTTVERANSGFKDDFGAKHIRVRGHAKVFSHMMSGIVAMTALRIVVAFQ
jgi:hypothetical protein